jgi:hypothetical protein
MTRYQVAEVINHGQARAGTLIVKLVIPRGKEDVPEAPIKLPLFGKGFHGPIYMRNWIAQEGQFTDSPFTCRFIRDGESPVRPENKKNPANQPFGQRGALVRVLHIKLVSEPDGAFAFYPK